MSNNLLHLLSLYVIKEISKEELYELYELVAKMNLRLTNRHYKKFQIINDYRTDEKQRIRVDLFFDFVHENQGKTANWILSAYQRRFAWFELLVDCKYYGINIFHETESISKAVNSKRTSDLVKNLSIYRSLRLKKGREPSETEFAIQLIKEKIKLGKQVKFSSIHRMAYDTLNYLYCLRYSDPIGGFDETKRQVP